MTEKKLLCVATVSITLSDMAAVTHIQSQL